MQHQKVPLRAVLLIAFALLTLASISPATHSVAATVVATTSVYLPIVRVPPPAPQLLAPANGSTASLAPVLSWTVPMTGTYQVQIATDAMFATTVLSKTLKYSDRTVTTASTLADNSNLDEQTLFFWRVGLLFNGAFSYAPVRTFTTPVENQVSLPAQPAPLGATPLSESVTVHWQTVPGALYYRVNIDTEVQKGIRSALITAPATTVVIDGLTPGTIYVWRVRALNAAGWGKDAKAPGFTTQP